jgi:hypothetical protein
MLGVAVAFYVALSLARGQVHARSGMWSRDFYRDTDAWGYWSAIVCYTLLSAALIFAF